MKKYYKGPPLLPFMKILNIIINDIFYHLNGIKLSSKNYISKKSVLNKRKNYLGKSFNVVYQADLAENRITHKKAFQID